jgi:hypothetical protein
MRSTLRALSFKSGPQALVSLCHSQSEGRSGANNLKRRPTSDHYMNISFH